MHGSITSTVNDDDYVVYPFKSPVMSTITLKSPPGKVFSSMTTARVIRSI
jgi:hypothetical protein